MPSPLNIFATAPASCVEGEHEPGPAGGSLTNAALAYAAQRIPIFPCGTDKKPLTPHGFKDATMKPAAILNWWAQHPGAMIGMPTGEATGLVVVDLDVDPAKGLDGPAAWAALVLQHGEPVATRTHRTPRGGLHLVFRHPGEKVKSTTSALAAGIDTRGDGGYVILPPSRNGAAPYTVEVDADPAQMPAWLIAQLRKCEIMQATGEHDDLGHGVTRDMLRKKPTTKRKAAASDAPSREKIENALRRISANCPFDVWLSIGMALHSWNPDEGRELWDTWSATAPSRYDSDVIEKHWKTFTDKPDGITIATVFKLAMENDPVEVKFGPPYFTSVNKDGEENFNGVNEAYWAGFHAANNVELYEPDERSFYRYGSQTGLYAEVSPDVLKQEVSVDLLKRGRIEKLMGLTKSRTDATLRAIASQLKGLVERRGAFQKRTHFVHLANCMLKLDGQDPSPLPFSPDYFSRNQSPVSFAKGATCPRFLAELICPAVHAEDVAILQKYVGLCLLGRNIIQRMLILDGEAGRGKTQLALVIQLVVGQLNCTQLRTEQLGGRFELYRFLKRTLLTGVDVPPDFLSTKGAGVLKGLVGGDIFDAEQKGGTGSFPLEGTFCAVVTSNTRLRVRIEGDVGAWRRRLLIVRYECPPPRKKIPDFGKLLVEQEGPGILNWALVGLAALLSDVESIGDIAMTARQSGIVDALLSESDSLRVFLRECVEKSPGADLTVSEIIEAYAEFCPRRGWNPLPITIIQREIEGLMLELFQVTKANSIERGTAHRGFRGVRFMECGTLGTPFFNPRADDVEERVPLRLK
jgi:putative DNA primase/helicase